MKPVRPHTLRLPPRNTGKYTLCDLNRVCLWLAGSARCSRLRENTENTCVCVCGGGGGGTHVCGKEEKIDTENKQEFKQYKVVVVARAYLCSVNSEIVRVEHSKVSYHRSDGDKTKLHVHASVCTHMDQHTYIRLSLIPRPSARVIFMCDL